MIQNVYLHVVLVRNLVRGEYYVNNVDDVKNLLRI